MENADGVRTLKQYYYWLNTAFWLYLANFSWIILIWLIVRELIGEGKQVEGGRLS